MDFDFQWVLLALPVAFALGWLASRLDLRQWQRAQRESPRAYFKGLNLLLNEQQDKAVDAFIEAVQHDPGTSDLHFALGNLFRRRGEYERAVRVHEHLLKRADLPAAERDRAQHGLAQDYMKAGLFDRAEQAWHALEGTAFDTEARLALLTLHERSRDWRAAIEDAQKLERSSGTGSYAPRIAHYWCELALQAQAANHEEDASRALQCARDAAPQAARPLVIEGQALAARGRHREALDAFDKVMALHPESFNLVTDDYVASALACGEALRARDALLGLYQRGSSLALLAALGRIEPDAQAQRERLLAHLRAQPSLSAASQLLAQADGNLAEPAGTLLAAAIAHVGKPLRRYRCAACGFEAQNYFWQCPGCLNWDSYPPMRLEDL